VPADVTSLLYCDHTEGDGEGLFRLACENDLEGIVSKQKYSPYLTEQKTTWFKIRNRNYSQWAGREELFERERGGDPDVRHWDSCVSACAAIQV
jgi:ATP-dependent DNA ligase